MKEQANLLFCAIETVVPNHFRVQNVRKISDGERHELIKDTQAMHALNLLFPSTKKHIPCFRH